MLLSPSKGAYTNGRCTTDVWAYMLLAAKTQKEKISCFPSGICVSSAFDGTRGDKHLEVTSNVLNEDEKNGDPRSY